ncbi:PcfJ domain-containing protein [Tumebacillus flagellatus]|uniref:PcfJ-like protein n=1 Tax=Tumebacillus flagellatus TaxID=1157490 RepID=A0A074LXE8_9BACL|nr:PcfJ domain-containing protein [Tumebacillus flagellatus]KEO84778.1 hypothetical protein EL26_01845 [Tumebacillus flagellatus]
MSNHEEFFAHFPTNFGHELEDFVTNTVLLHSRYLVVRRVKKDQYGYCTHCRKEYPVSFGRSLLKHNEDWQCQNCKSLVIVKSLNRGRKYLFDIGYVVWYEKSKVNPNAIVARGIRVSRDYRSNVYDVNTTYKTVSLYLFEPSENGVKGRSKQLRLSERENRWDEAANIQSELSTRMNGLQHVYLGMESVYEAVKGTPFQYSMWKVYLDESWDLVRFFDLAAKYPCVEYLTKLGYRSFVDAKLTGGYTYNSINWNEKSIDRVLRLSKAELKRFRAEGVRLTPQFLRSYQMCRKHGVSATFEQVEKMQDLIDPHNSDELKLLLRYSPYAKVGKYLIKQMEKRKQYRYFNWVMRDWRDYINECLELGLDLRDEQILYPRDLHAAHQRTSTQVKVKRDEAQQALFAKRFDELKKFIFRRKGLILRPVQNVDELINEGETLRHCVGGYSARYAKGETDLFVVRKVNAPDTPFYTMEVCGGRLSQCRGHSNRDMTEEVKDFVDAFVAEKLFKKSKKRGRKTDDKLGVAV